MNEKKIRKFIFVPGKIKQWKKFEYKNFSIWLAGLNKRDKFEQIKNYLNDEVKNLKKSNIFKILGDQFGVIILHDNWIFSATDPIRSYPIFWKINKNIIFLSPQANLLKTKHDIVNYEQLIAYRMSGYTTNDQTLWKNIYNLKVDLFLFLLKNLILQYNNISYISPGK